MGEPDSGACGARLGPVDPEKVDLLVLASPVVHVGRLLGQELPDIAIPEYCVLFSGPLRPISRFCFSSVPCRGKELYRVSYDSCPINVVA